MGAPTVAFEMFDAVFQYAALQGVPERSLLEQAGLPSKPDCQIEGRVPLAFYERLFVAAEHMLNDPYVGYRIGSHPFPASWGVLYYLILSADSIQQILQAIQKYFPIALDFIDFDIQLDQARTFRIQLHHKTTGRPHRHVIEHLMANWYTVAQQLQFDDDNVPRVLGLAQPAPSNRTVIAETFGHTPVLFDQHYDYVDLPVESLGYRNGNHNRAIFRLMEKYAERLMVSQHCNDRFLDALRNEIAQLLPNGSPRIEMVATRLNCSGRTLQRRLSDRNLTYQQLVDQIRRQRAEELLRQNSVSIATIAMKTGFHDESAFHKAFKRWTGLSPGQYRKVPENISDSRL